MSFTTTQSVLIVKMAPPSLNLSFEELDKKCVKIMEGKGHIGVEMDYWDFIEKNRWGLSTVLGNKDRIITGSFSVTHNTVFHAYLCKSCKGIFQLPFESEECMFCGHKDMEKAKKRARVRDTHGRAGVQDGVNPELYAMAVKDIQEHGTTDAGPTFEPDWQYLEDNI